MVRSIKKNCKLRTSKKKYNQKGGFEITLEELKADNGGNISIHINLVDKKNREILSLIKEDEIYNIQSQIKDEISRLLETYLETNQNSVSLDEDGDIKTLFTNWDVQIYLQTNTNKQFPFHCYIKFISALPLNHLQLDTVTKVITESDFLPIEITINDTTHEFNLISYYSNLGNTTMNYSITKKEWEDEKEIECGFTNGVGSNPRSAFSCFGKIDCKKPTRKEQIEKISKKYGRNDIVCFPKYSKFNFNNELIARETDETTWNFNVDKLCSSKNVVSCKIGKNGCHWDKAKDRCAVNPADFLKRKNLNYY
jgi:hypothetical protein